MSYILLWRRGEETYVPQTYHRRDLVPKPQPPEAMGDFLKIFVIFGKNSFFDAIWITFCTFLKPFKRTRFLKFENQLKKLNCSILFLLTILV